MSSRSLSNLGLLGAWSWLTYSWLSGWLIRDEWLEYGAPSKDLGLGAHWLVSLDRYFCFNKYIHTNKNNLIFPFPLPNKKKIKKEEEDEWRSRCLWVLENPNKPLSRLLCIKNSADHLVICRTWCTSLAVFCSWFTWLNGGPMSKNLLNFDACLSPIHMVITF